MSPLFAMVFVLLVGVLVLASYVERIIHEQGKFLARNFQENIEAYEQEVEPQLGRLSGRVPLTFMLLVRLTDIALAMLLTYVVIGGGQWQLMEIVQAGLMLVVVVLVFNQIVPYLLFSRTCGGWLKHFTPLLRVFLVLLLPVTLFLNFFLQVVALAEPQGTEQPETPAEAVEALIDAGREEGILEESDRQLIQSVVEFGDKTVREVMTPRPRVTAVPIETTIEQLTEMLREKQHTRVLVYEGSLDDVRGIVVSHDILQVPDAEARTRTVATLLKPVPFVPESKPVQDLLREMQRDKTRMAVVINEYGNLAGVVTIEDMVEEIVGEISDDHEKDTGVVREGNGKFVLSGSADVDHLDQLFDQRFDFDQTEEVSATSVGGLVSELAGHIPAKGEIVLGGGLRFEVLEASGRSVEKVRVTSVPEQV